MYVGCVCALRMYVCTSRTRSMYVMYVCVVCMLCLYVCYVRMFCMYVSYVRMAVYVRCVCVRVCMYFQFAFCV